MQAGLTLTGVVTDVREFTPPDNPGMTFRTVEIYGVGVSVPSAFNKPLPTMGQYVTAECLPNGKKSPRLIAWVPAQNGVQPGR